MRRVLAAVALLSAVGFNATASEVDSQSIDYAAKSVFQIRGVQGEGYRYACTGFLVADERILTANHCVGEKMTVAGVPVTEVVGRADYYDLALLAVPVHGRPLPLRDTPLVRFEHLAALGHAYGWSRISSFHVRVYHIDLRPSAEMAPGILVKPGFIGGMSGGPMIDQYGEVVGVIQASTQEMGYGVGTVLIRAFLVGLL